MDNSYYDSISNNNNEHYHSIVDKHNADVENYGNNSFEPNNPEIELDEKLEKLNEYRWIKEQQAILAIECEMAVMKVEMDRKKVLSGPRTPGPIVENHILIGYVVKSGDGFTQIAAYLNDPKTQEKFEYTLKRDIQWYELSEHPQNLRFTRDANIENNPNYSFSLPQEEVVSLYQPIIRNEFDKGYCTNPSLKAGDVLYIDPNLSKTKTIVKKEKKREHQEDILPSILPPGVDPPMPGGVPMLLGPAVMVFQLIMDGPHTPLHLLSPVEPSHMSPYKCYYNPKWDGYFEWHIEVIDGERILIAEVFEGYDHYKGEWRGHTRTNRIYFQYVEDHWEYRRDDKKLYYHLCPWT